MSIARCIEVVAQVFDLSIDQITGPKKGAATVTRARAVAAYLASTECGMSDQSIANYLKRDRASISHMLKLIESIRDHDKVDEWLDQLASRALCPPKPCSETLGLLITTNVDDLLEYKPKPKTTTALQWGADRALVEVSAKYDTSPRDLLSSRTPSAIRHEAWRALYQFTSLGGRRIFNQSRIATLSGVCQQAVSKALKG